jgi:glycerol-3-phosphate cytidylyltransferase
MPTLKTSNGIIRYKTYPLYLGIKPIDKEKSKENLFLFQQICKKNNLSFGIIAGTLLGAVREHDFIAHDEDIDVFLTDEDKEHFFATLPQFMEQGFIVARYDRRGLLSIIRNGEYIDIYFFSEYKENIRICSGWCIPEKYLINVDFIDFLGGKFLAPKDYYGFLEFEYGKEWKTPIPYTDFKINTFKLMLIKIKEHIKDILPDCIYFRLIRKNERKIIDKYMQKIKQENL